MSPHTDAGELLPCPFCGKPPAVEMTGFHMGARTIYCANNDCMGPSTTAQNMDDATVQWNRRQAASHGSAGGEPSEVRTEQGQHIAWLYQYVRCMNERNWRDMQDNLENQLDRMTAGDPAQAVPDSYQETVRKVSAAREKGYAAARANLQEAWAALAMIRETVETLAPSGSVKAAEHLDGPTFMHEAEALVAGILAMPSADREGK